MWFRKLSIFKDSQQDQQWSNLVRFFVNPKFGTETSYTEITNDGMMIAPKYFVSTLNTAPALSTSNGTAGEVRFTDSAIYVCVATNTWKKTALATF